MKTKTAPVFINEFCESTNHNAEHTEILQTKIRKSFPGETIDFAPPFVSNGNLYVKGTIANPQKKYKYN